MRNPFMPLFPALLILLISLLAGCASTPDFDTKQVDQSLTPQSVIAEPDASRGKIALWGGTILDTRNQEKLTRIEVLAYPLNSSQRPLLESKPLGRFIVQYKGYLEPTTFAQGRLITIIGSVGDSQSGMVGESSYTYPVINAQQVHLWSQDDSGSRTSFHLGIGVRL